jgi:hypothetical protein
MRRRTGAGRSRSGPKRGAFVGSTPRTTRRVPASSRRTGGATSWRSTQRPLVPYTSAVEDGARPSRRRAARPVLGHHGIETGPGNGTVSGRRPGGHGSRSTGSPASTRSRAPGWSTGAPGSRGGAGGRRWARRRSSGRRLAPPRTGDPSRSESPARRPDGARTGVCVRPRRGRGRGRRSHRRSAAATHVVRTAGVGGCHDGPTYRATGRCCRARRSPADRRGSGSPRSLLDLGRRGGERQANGAPPHHAAPMSRPGPGARRGSAHLPAAGPGRGRRWAGSPCPRSPTPQAD